MTRPGAQPGPSSTSTASIPVAPDNHPPAECRQLHIALKLVNPRPGSNATIRANCPHCGSRSGFAIFAPEGMPPGIRHRWACHRCQIDPYTLRRELVKAGIGEACLGRYARARPDQRAERMLAALTDTDLDLAARVLHAIAAYEGRAELPRGRELEQLAVRAGLHRATAYRARGGQDRQNPISTSTELKVVKQPRSER